MDDQFTMVFLRRPAYNDVYGADDDDDDDDVVVDVLTETTHMERSRTGGSSTGPAVQIALQTSTYS